VLARTDPPGSEIGLESEGHRGGAAEPSSGTMSHTSSRSPPAVIRTLNRTQSSPRTWGSRGSIGVSGGSQPGWKRATLEGSRRGSSSLAPNLL